MFSSGEGGLYETSGSHFRSTGHLALDLTVFGVGIGCALMSLILAPLALVGRRDKGLLKILVVNAFLLGGYIILFVSRP